MTEDQREAEKRCVKYRKRILGLSQKLGALHIAPAFSCLEIVDALYYGVMRRYGIRPIEEEHSFNFIDTFILSKGHGALAQYVVLEGLGILKESDLDNICRPSGRLGGHPDCGIPGVEVSTGSLGHGLPIALGMALADKIFKVNRTVYVLMSDAEMQEGSVWEAMLFAPALGLSNLIVIVDSNNFQVLDTISKINPNFYPMSDKVLSFGWELGGAFGHDLESIKRSIHDRKGRKPLLVLAQTVKGKGVSFMENNPIWNFRSPSEEEYGLAIKELGRGE